jgi:hypothetical protein
MLAMLRCAEHATEGKLASSKASGVAEPEVEGDVTLIDVHVEMPILVGSVADHEGVVVIKGIASPILQVGRLPCNPDGQVSSLLTVSSL